VKGRDDDHDRSDVDGDTGYTADDGIDIMDLTGTTTAIVGSTIGGLASLGSAAATTTEEGGFQLPTGLGKSSDPYGLGLANSELYYVSPENKMILIEVGGGG
jgi:hypothetical protein